MWKAEAASQGSMLFSQCMSGTWRQTSRMTPAETWGTCWPPCCRWTLLLLAFAPHLQNTKQRVCVGVGGGDSGTIRCQPESHRNSWLDCSSHWETHTLQHCVVLWGLTMLRCVCVCEMLVASVRSPDCSSIPALCCFLQFPSQQKEKKDKQVVTSHTSMLPIRGSPLISCYNPEFISCFGPPPSLPNFSSSPPSSAAGEQRRGFWGGRGFSSTGRRFFVWGAFRRSVTVLSPQSPILEYLGQGFPSAGWRRQIRHGRVDLHRHPDSQELPAASGHLQSLRVGRDAPSLQPHILLSANFIYIDAVCCPLAALRIRHPGHHWCRGDRNTEGLLRYPGWADGRMYLRWNALGISVPVVTPSLCMCVVGAFYSQVCQEPSALFCPAPQCRHEGSRHGWGHAHSRHCWSLWGKKKKKKKRNWRINGIYMQYPNTPLGEVVINL